MMNVKKGFKRHFLPISVSVLPYATLLLIFLADPRSMAIAIALSSLYIVLPAILLIGLFIQAKIESSWRRMDSDLNRYPLFALTIGFFLLLFWVPLLLMPPILRKIPAYNVVTKAVEWQTDGGSLVLVLTGIGNADRHSFLSGKVKWTGGPNAGFTSLHIQPLEFQHNYFDPHFAGSKLAIEDRLSSTKLEQDRVEALATDLWNILQQVNQGEPVSSHLGKVSAPEFRIDKILYYRVSGFVWLCLLIAAMLIVGTLDDSSIRTTENE